MASSKSDKSAANQLKISLQVITRAQAWTKQIRGAYTFLYPYITGDFAHLEDLDAWLKLYAQHQHGNGNNGSNTTPPVKPGDYTTDLAEGHNQENDAIGKFRDGFSDAEQLLDAFAEFKKRKE